MYRESLTPDITAFCGGGGLIYMPVFVKFAGLMSSEERGMIGGL